MRYAMETRIEDLLADKLYEAVNVVLQKFIKPDFTYGNVRELSIDKIELIKESLVLKV